jgi:putative ABC transport system substrate-binding protein
MRRREFITLVGGAAAGWPLVVRAQQGALRVVGFISARTRESDRSLLAAFRQGLSAAGYVENQNVAIQYRFAEGQYDRLPAMAADLVRRQVTAIVTAGGTQSAVQGATPTIPMVFATAADPIEAGLIASLSRPGGNVTGVTNLNAEVGSRLLKFLHEAVPTATIIGLLVNSTGPGVEEATLTPLQPAPRTFGLQLHVLHARTEPELEKVFANPAEVRAGALMISPDPFFTSQSE